MLLKDVPDADCTNMTPLGVGAHDQAVLVDELREDGSDHRVFSKLPALVDDIVVVQEIGIDDRRVVGCGDQDDRQLDEIGRFAYRRPPPVPPPQI